VSFVSISARQHRALVAAQMSEATLQAQVLEAARLLGWLVYHTHDSRRSQPGFPDLVLVHPGKRRVLYRELKTQKGRIRPQQQVWLDALAAAGQDAGVWRPADWLDGGAYDELAAWPGVEGGDGDG